MSRYARADSRDDALKVGERHHRQGERVRVAQRTPRLPLFLGS